MRTIMNKKKKTCARQRLLRASLRHLRFCVPFLGHLVVSPLNTLFTQIKNENFELVLLVLSWATDRPLLCGELWARDAIHKRESSLCLL